MAFRALRSRGFNVQGSQGLGFFLSSFLMSACRVQGLGLRVPGLGFRVQGLGLKVEGLGLRV